MNIELIKSVIAACQIFTGGPYGYSDAVSLIQRSQTDCHAFYFKCLKEDAKFPNDNAEFSNCAVKRKQKQDAEDKKFQIKGGIYFKGDSYFKESSDPKPTGQKE